MLQRPQQAAVFQGEEQNRRAVAGAVEQRPEVRVGQRLAAGEHEEQGAQVGQIVEQLEPRLDAQGLRELFVDVELPLARLLAKLERTGICVDPSTLERLEETYRGRVAELEAKGIDPDVW